MSSTISDRFRGLLLCVIFLLPSGCVAMRSGDGQSPAALTEPSGRLARTYEYGYPETVRAGMTSLGQMGIPVVRELSDEQGTTIKAVLPGGTPVNVDIVDIGAGMTEVAVRAGASGVWDSKAAEELQASIAEMLQVLQRAVVEQEVVASVAESSPEKTTQATDETTQTTTPSKKKKQKASAPGGKNTSADVSKQTAAGPRPQFTLFFDANSNELSPEQMKTLDEIARHILETPNAKVKLNGYTDSWGNAGYNKMVSEARASAVKFYLISRGISPGNIKVAGHGAKKFLADNKTVKGRNKNRRVEIVIHTGKNN